MEGWRAEAGRGELLPPKPCPTDVPSQLRQGLCSEAPSQDLKSESQALALVASRPLDLPGIGGQETQTPKAEVPGASSPGRLRLKTIAAAAAGSLPQAWFMLLAEPSFFLSLPLYFFGFFSGFFFLLGLFLGQCSPDIWFTVNSIDCIGLSQEMEEIAFSFFFSFSISWLTTQSQPWVGQALQMHLTWWREWAFVPLWLEGDRRWEGNEQRVAS